MSDHNTLPPDDDNRIDLETLVDALTPENQVGQPNEYYPSKGRVLEDDVDGTMYLGDGDQWLPIDADVGLATPAVSTDDATVNNSVTSPDGSTVTGGALHLLRQAGYNSGDFVPVISVNAQTSSDSVSSDTYTISSPETMELRVRFSDIFPSDATLAVYASFLVDDGGDTVDYRIRDAKNSRTIAELTGLTGSFVYTTLGPKSFNVANRDAESRIIPEMRNSDGATAVTVFDSFIAFGVLL